MSFCRTWHFMIFNQNGDLSLQDESEGDDFEGGENDDDDEEDDDDEDDEEDGGGKQSSLYILLNSSLWSRSSRQLIS